MSTRETRLTWRAITESNPWWSTGDVPALRTRPFRRPIFDDIFRALRDARRGRGVVVLGPRRVGKTVLVHQIVEALLALGTPADRVVMLTLDDVALRNRDLGELLDLITARNADAEERYLILDEVQHSPHWSGWLKRIADRREPWIFLATGSSATALRHGAQDAGVGRWREIMLYPWSFREHVMLRGIEAWTFRFWDTYDLELQQDRGPGAAWQAAAKICGERPIDEDDALERALTDYLAVGGFPELAEVPEFDLREAQRHLRQDILDRSLGRDVVDVTGVDTSALERMFLRICAHPGGLWNVSEVAAEIGVTRPTINRYAKILEQAFLATFLPNFSAPIRAQPKSYLVAPSLRAALYALDRDAVREPEEWGRLVENVVVVTAIGTATEGARVGFWRRGNHEIDLIVTDGRSAEYIEVKRSGHGGVGNLQRAANHLKIPGVGILLSHRVDDTLFPKRVEEHTVDAPLRYVLRVSAIEWLYLRQRGARIAPGG